ncbi:hypothetical protein RB623_13035 [Mesorhizobium sp. LHD-90]|uniref:hypothetical protein n=1 Tax=Mesorhizobium sp. LHD-90 TaxID=3071414 RepID=UPI0027E097B8|nr:hypothetical protein [Mesorhizobium sp. LHD-90]MDQ6434973.1 hypothetical protein [Mesorhizobium sp. LHD-90]
MTKLSLSLQQGTSILLAKTAQSLAEKAYDKPQTERFFDTSIRLLGLSKTRRIFATGLVANRLKNAGPDDVRVMLEGLAQLEAIRAAAPASAGRRIGELLVSDEGRETIRAAAGEALERFPRSAFLIYLHVATLAKSGAYQEAHDFVMEAIQDCQKAMASGHATPEETRRFNSLNKTWRIVDEISRDNMTWANGGDGYGGGDDGQEDSGAGDEAASIADESGGGTKSEEGSSGEDDHGASASGPDGGAEQDVAAESETIVTPATGNEDDGKFVFAERLIQGRQHDRYLLVCKRQFDDAQDLAGKFKAINAMLRQGIRRIPSYEESHRLARICFKQIRPLWLEITGQKVIQTQIDKLGVKTLALARLLRTALQISRDLGLPSDVARFEKALLYLAQKPKAIPALWLIAAALVESNAAKYEEITLSLLTGASRKPQKEHEIRDFFLWALNAQRYDVAHDFVKGLPEKEKRSKAFLQYGRILQRDGQFERATILVKRVHETLLCRPHSIDPRASWNLIRRVGELEFAAETAKWFSRVPQPQQPEGVIFIAPRSFEQLRKYPLVVLMEMKKMGWSVIPLVKGVMPLEKTGNPQIDRFLGCISPECEFDRKAKRFLKPIEGFEANVAQGELRWNNIDLEHIVWEEAAINRRRYNVDYTCPVLQKFLGRLVEWTRLTAVVLENINRSLVSAGIDCGFMVLQQSRLPDAIVRFYLEEFGDPEKFFCIHSANGYQNYFANFTSVVSTKTTVRNITLHRELRTASFPIPREFVKFYDENKHRGPEMWQAIQDVAQTRRSTGGQAERPQEAVDCLERIREWREHGGKVACLFGKVVCDSAVPFDGGPAHLNMKDWLNHAIDSVRGSNTLLLIKPHPHEMRHDIGVFLTESFQDLIEIDLPENVIVLGHRWFDLQDLDGLIDLGVIYNGTSSAELGLLGIPCVVCGHFAPIDYPIGHVVPKSRLHFRRILRFSQRISAAKDLKERAAAWIYFMSSDRMSRDYRYHARQITNRVVYPPWWFRDDIERYLVEGDENVRVLARRAIESAHGHEDGHDKLAAE